MNHALCGTSTNVTALPLMMTSVPSACAATGISVAAAVRKKIRKRIDKGESNTYDAPMRSPLTAIGLHRSVNMLLVLGLLCACTQQPEVVFHGPSTSSLSSLSSL